MIFCSESSRHCLSQTVRAGELEFWENVQCSPPTMCHMSRVKCHVSLFFSFLQGCWTSRWRVCYQQGLPHLVPITNSHWFRYPQCIQSFYKIMLKTSGFILCIITQLLAYGVVLQLNLCVFKDGLMYSRVIQSRRGALDHNYQLANHVVGWYEPIFKILNLGTSFQLPVHFFCFTMGITIGRRAKKKMFFWK